MKLFPLVVVAVLAAGTAQAAEELGDAGRGAELFKDCAQCHQIGEGAVHRIGPHLNGLFDRGAGQADGFNYSSGFKRAAATGLDWDAGHLDAYIENPRSLISGTRMSYRGMKDPQDRADLIAFLRQFSANPRDIPEAAPTARATDHDLDPAILAVVGDPAYGEYLSSECVTCHQMSGEDKGIPSITGWPTEDFVVAMHAYKNKTREHPVMQMMAGRLNTEEIAALAAYFAGLGQ